jgi:hypothetical protein
MYENIPKPVVKPPKSSTKPISCAQGVRNNLAWLKQHYLEYQGQWVALNEGLFLGAEESFVKLRRQLQQSSLLNVALFFNLK